MAQKLRLSPEERDLLLLAAGFAPEAGLSQATVLLPLFTVINQPAEVENEEQAVEEAESLPARTQLTTSLAETPEPSRQLVQPIFTQSPRPAAVEILLSMPNRIARRWLSPWIIGVVLMVLLMAGLLLNTLMRTLLLPVTTPVIDPAPTKAGFYKAPKALPGQTLILIAEFTGFSQAQFNVANRLRDGITEQIQTAGLINTTVFVLPAELQSEQQAVDVLATAGARMIIWGEYDDGRVLANLRVASANGTGQRETEKIEKLLSPADDLRTIINAAVPAEMRILALMALGQFYRDEAKYAQAGAAFQRAINLKPEAAKTRALLYFYLGTVLEHERSEQGYMSAIQAYSQALTQNPRLYDASYNRGTAYLNRSYIWGEKDARIQADLTAAIDDLTTTLIARSTYRNAWLNRGIAYYERHDSTEDDLAHALKDVEQAIRLDDKAMDGYFHRGLIRIRAGGQGDWAGDFAKALEIAPANNSAQNALCWGYGLAQKAELALPACDKAVAGDKTKASFDSRGLVYAQLGHYQEAISDYEAYLAYLKTLAPAQYTRQRGALVEEWINQLKQGKNPFDAATLAGLR